VDLMYTVSSRDALPVLLHLLRASKRRGAQWACFFTDSGVETLDSPELRNLLSSASQAVACEFSWERYRAGMPCPIESGSQTNNSAMTADAKHLVSL
jgi:hypothetical protein